MLLRLIEDGKPEIFAKILHPCRNCKDSAVEESGNGQFVVLRKGGYEYGFVEANAFMNRIISCLLKIPTDGLGNSQTGIAEMHLICSQSLLYR